MDLFIPYREIMMCTPNSLSRAISSNDYELLIKILKDDTLPFAIKDPNQTHRSQSPYEWPLLSYCIVCGKDIKFLRALLDHGANINTVYNNPLHSSEKTSIIFENIIINQHNKQHQDPASFEKFCFLLENGYDLSIKDNNDNNILHKLCTYLGDNDNERKLRFLLNLDLRAELARPDRFEKSSNLNLNSDLILNLINEKNNDGNTPLICAVKENSSLDLIKFLIEKGADPYVSNNEYPNLFICACYSNGSLEIIDYFLNTPSLCPWQKREDLTLASDPKINFDINTIDKEGCNALFSYNKNPDVIRYLILNGINIHKINDKGENALDFWINVKYHLYDKEGSAAITSVIHMLIDFGLDAPALVVNKTTLKFIYSRKIENIKNKIIKKYKKLSEQEQELIDISCVFELPFPERAPESIDCDSKINSSLVPEKSYLQNILAFVNKLKSLLKQLKDMHNYKPGFQELQDKYKNHPYFKSI